MLKLCGWIRNWYFKQMKWRLKWRFYFMHVQSNTLKKFNWCCSDSNVKRYYSKWPIQVKTEWFIFRYSISVPSGTEFFPWYDMTERNSVDLASVIKGAQIYSHIRRNDETLMQNRYGLKQWLLVQFYKSSLDLEPKCLGVSPQTGNNRAESMNKWDCFEPWKKSVV